MTTMKKFLAILLSAALLVSALVVPMVISAEDTLDIWDGTQVEPVDSDNDGVYEIGTPEELAWAVKNGGTRNYILTADIYVNDLAVNGETLTKLDGSEVDTEALEVWPAGSATYKGTLDGNGHTINGLYNATTPETASGSDGRGLFNRGNGATVKNLRLSNVYFANGTYMGGVFGYANEGTMLTVDNCYIENVTVSTSLASSGQCYPSVGGVVGYIQNSGLTINNTAIINAEITGSRDGSILGDAWQAGANTITNTYVVSSREPYGNGTSSTSSFAGAVTASNFYSTTPSTGTVAPQATTVSVANMTGTAAVTNMPGLGDAFYITNGTPALKVFNKDFNTNVWGGFRDSNLEGEGTAESPYLIYTAEELAYAINSGLNNVFQMQNDIVLNDIVVKIEDGVGVIYEADGETLADKSALIPWTSGSFPGTIDGNGYVVRGMYFEGTPAADNGSTPAWQRNFAFIKRATLTTVVENLGLEDSYVVATDGTAAGFVGYLQAYSPIVRNSYVGSSVYLEGTCVGGILGSGDMKNCGENFIENCYVTATINCSGTRWGALYAETWSRAGSVRNVYSTMRLADGLSGVSAQTCYNDVTATKGFIGSIHDGNNMYLGNAFRAVEGGLPVLKVFDHNDMAWGGLGGIFFDGDGSPETPYQISDASQLAYMVYSAGNGKYYELTNDIVITNLDDVDWATSEAKEDIGYAPIPWFSGTNSGGMSYQNVNSSVGKFTGFVDGNGYAVSGIYYEPYYKGRDIENDGKWNTSAGLIPSIESSTVSDIIITDSYIFGGRFTGAVIGYASNATLNNLVVTNTVAVNTVNVGLENGEAKNFESCSAGGIVGYAQGTINMDSCGTSAKITSAGHLNGLFGTRWNTIINVTNSYSVGARPLAVDGAANGSTTATNVYTNISTTDAPEGVVVLATEEITGKTALAYMDGFDTNYWYGVTDQGPLPYRYGARIIDINCDGKFDFSTDAAALRVAIITDNTSAYFADRTEDGFINICDLVNFCK